MGFASRGPPSPKRMGFAPSVSPSPSEWDSHQEGHPLQSEWDSLQEILLLPNDNVLSRGTQILLDDGIHPELRLVRLKLRDPSRGLLPPVLIHLHNKIRKLKTPLCQPQLMPWWILDFLRDKVPDFRYLPISIKEGIANERSLRSCLESHNFLTWLVMAFIRSLHEKNFCLRTIQLSPSCRSPLPGAVTVWLLPHLQMLPSSPWRGDSLSVESACSATHDLSLFKPHLKTSSSTTPSRRSPCSSSRSRRALLDYIFLSIFFAAIFFPFQTVFWQEGRLALPEEVLRNPPQWGGCRK